MSSGQKRRNHDNFPKMKLRGRRYRTRMTAREDWQEEITSLRRAFTRTDPRLSMAQMADVLVRFGQAAPITLAAVGAWDAMKLVDPNATITEKLL